MFSRINPLRKDNQGAGSAANVEMPIRVLKRDLLEGKTSMSLPQLVSMLAGNIYAAAAYKLGKLYWETVGWVSQSQHAAVVVHHRCVSLISGLCV